MFLTIHIYFAQVLLAPVVVVCLSSGVFSLSSIPKEAYLVILLVRLPVAHGGGWNYMQMGYRMR
jgi:hypothetical protein